MSSGTEKPWRCISPATLTISSRDGVISPESPTRSASTSLAVARIFAPGTMTPRSITSKLLHCSTTPTMFLPMSWTSPRTVAITSLFLEPVPVFSASMKGTRWATAFFITRADFTTWGRNILPAPKRSPTMFIPSISGPSITSSGRVAAWRASSVSSRTCWSIPCTSACSRRLDTGQPRQSSATRVLLPERWSR